MSDERVSIFIDGSNLFHGLKQDFSNINLDFEKFSKKLVGDRKLCRIYYYSSLPKQADNPTSYAKQQSFYSAIQKIPYFKVILGRIEKHGTNFVEKGVDVTLAVDMLDLAFSNVYDTAIIVSGDADFSHAVEVVQRLGKHVENYTTPSCKSNELEKMCDTSELIDQRHKPDNL